MGLWDRAAINWGVDINADKPRKGGWRHIEHWRKTLIQEAQVWGQLNGKHPKFLWGGGKNMEGIKKKKKIQGKIKDWELQIKKFETDAFQVNCTRIYANLNFSCRK